MKSCENFLDPTRKNVSKSQEEVVKTQQTLTEAQQNHVKWVDEVSQAEQRLIAFQTQAATLCAAMEQVFPDWAKELRKLREGEQIADSEKGASEILQASGGGHVNLRGSTRTPPEGGFCSRLRRRHQEVDAGLSSRHSSGHHRKQCSRGGTIVPRDGLGRQSPRLHRWCPKQSCDEASPEVWSSRRQGRGGKSPRPSSQTPQVSGEISRRFRVTGTSENDEP